nr:hypothetical protein [Tanacetum cinerariifolium]
MSHNTLMALIKFLLKKRPNIVGKAAGETTEEVVSEAVVHTFDTHENRRSKKSTKTAAALDLLKGFNYCDVKICEEILQKGNHEALELLHLLVEDAKSDEPTVVQHQKF